jgi:dephospho-CoA kinase
VLIALTGGIGSGKSTVAARWVSLGATEVDADLLAREAVEPGTAGLKEIIEHFGEGILTPEGILDRAKLAAIAFSSKDNRKVLEEILHPKIQQLAMERTSNIDGVVVYTIPLYVETTSPLKFDHVVAISCDVEVRKDRLVSNRGMSPEEAQKRIASQATDAEREAAASYVIDSNCSLEELMRKADALYHELTSGH